MYSVHSLNHLAFVHPGQNDTVGYSNRKEEWFQWTCFHCGFRETILSSSCQCISVFLVLNELVNIGFVDWLKMRGYRLWLWGHNTWKLNRQICSLDLNFVNELTFIFCRRHHASTTTIYFHKLIIWNSFLHHTYANLFIYTRYAA